MDKKQKIALGKEIATQIATHISQVWPGFTPTPFILFDDKSQVAITTEPGQKINLGERYTQAEENVWVAEGRDPLLGGCMPWTHEGTRYAIWDTRTWPEDVSLATASDGVAHEMFHVHQDAFTDTGDGNDSIALHYPFTPKVVALLIEENRLLLEIFNEPTKATITRNMSKIISMRTEREAIVGSENFIYDTTNETSEGTATYAGIRMSALVQGTSAFEVAKAGIHVQDLRQYDVMLSHYRRRCYATGLALCLAADVLWPQWQTEWVASGQRIYCWIADKFEGDIAPVTVTPEALAQGEALLTAFYAGKQEKLAAFLDQPLTVIEGNVKMTGINPMNVVCHNGQCLHGFGWLNIGGQNQIIEASYITEYGDNFWQITRAIFPKRDVTQDGDTITIEGLGTFPGRVEPMANGQRCIIT